MEREETQNRAAAAALAEALGNLPLALEQAAAYATQAGLSLADYLELFRARRPEVEARATGAEEYPLALATTFDISFARLQSESPGGAELLTLCAFLAPDEVPLEILKDGAEHLPPALAAAAGDPEALAALATTLQNYALAKVRGGSFLTLHHFTQAAARDRLGEDDRKNWAGTVVRLMVAAFPFDRDNLQTWEASARLLHHAVAASEFTRELQVSEESAARLLNSVGRYLFNKAELAKSKAAFEQALELYTAISDSDHPNVAVCLNNLGLVLKELGDHKGARANYEHALSINEAAYGPDHPEVAVNLNNLGDVLHDLGDLEGARANYERSLRIGEAAHGPDHPRVAIRLSNLGLVLKAQGDLDGARANYERALRIDEAAYGPDHPDVAIDLNNLGLALKDQGDLDGARAHLERALRIVQEVLGKGHPSTLLVKRNLKSLLEKGEDEEGT
jgi:tetratricopeptide (TPR) repeat protein